MLPHHVESLTDYCEWLQQLVTNAGGHFENETLLVEPLVDAAGRERAYIFPVQRVLFWSDESFLAIRMFLTDELDLTDYSFHYMTSHRRVIWRKDNVHGGRSGGRPHLHLPPESGRHRRFGEVDLEEALGEVSDYQRDGRLPRPRR